jgi:hypothetical protein
MGGWYACHVWPYNLPVYPKNSRRRFSKNAERVHAVAISSLIFEKVLEKWQPSIYNLIWLAMTNVHKRHN